MTIVLLLLVLLATGTTTVLQVLLGNAAGALPSVALAAVLVAARHAPPHRLRWVAVLAGLVTGLLHEGSLLVPAMILLLLGSLAHRTRLFFPVRHARGLLLLGIVYALLEALLTTALTPAPLASLLARESLFPMATGIVLTGVLFVSAESVLRQALLLRHAIERP